MGRGMMTEDIKKLSRSFLGREMTARELRLIPYLVYTMVNSQALDGARVSAEEWGILDNIETEGHISGVDSRRITVSKEYWDFCHDILWLAYVNHDGAMIKEGS